MMYKKKWLKVVQIYSRWQGDLSFLVIGFYVTEEEVRCEIDPKNPFFFKDFYYYLLYGFYTNNFTCT